MQSDISKKETRFVAAGDKKIDVSVDGENVVVKFMIFESGLGWCCQKTLTMAADLADSLFDDLKTARIEARDANDDILSAELLLEI